MIFIRFGQQGASVTFSRALRKESISDTFILSSTDDGEVSSGDILLDKSNFFNFIISLFRIYFFLRKSTEKVIILMPSPYDWICLFKKNRKSSVYVIVHDDKTHQGDNFIKEWITQSFWKITKPKIITLSRFVCHSLENQGYHVSHVLFHPFFIDNLTTKDWLIRKYDIGIFGRFKSYQGVDNISWMRNIFNDLGFSIVFCGGRSKLFDDTLENESHFYGKIDDAEFFDIMANTRYILLPYENATQSGVIPNALALGCKVITTRVGGLPEQDFFNNIYFFELNHESLKEILSKIKLEINIDLKNVVYPFKLGPKEFLTQLKTYIDA